MCKRVWAAGAIALAGARVSAGQSTAAYRAQLDSLARLWRPLAAAEVREHVAPRSDVPPVALRVGILSVRTDSADLGIARAAAERLEPMVVRAYGTSADRLSHDLFLLTTTGTPLSAAVADSTGRPLLRGAVDRTVDAVFDAWQSRASEAFFEGLDPALKDWIGGAIPFAPLRRDDWSNTRIRLLLEGSRATRDCANGNVARCSQALGVSPPQNPLVDLYDPGERVAIIEGYMSILRRADAPKFDRCVQSHDSAACDSLGALIPSDAVPLPTTPAVRQEFVRFVLEQGGADALARFLEPGTHRERIERAARLPADTVVARWQARLSDQRTASTALDGTTAASSLIWAAACAALALRSSRWR